MAPHDALASLRLAWLTRSAARLHVRHVVRSPCSFRGPIGQCATSSGLVSPQVEHVRRLRFAFARFRSLARSQVRQWPRKPAEWCGDFGQCSAVSGFVSSHSLHVRSSGFGLDATAIHSAGMSQQSGHGSMW